MSTMNLNGNDTITALRPDDATRRAQNHRKAHDVAAQFEEFFVRMMVESFRKSQLSDEGGMFGDSAGSTTYEQWFDQYMSEHIADSTSIGIREVLVKDFQRNGELPKPEPVTDKQVNTDINDKINTRIGRVDIGRTVNHVA